MASEIESNYEEPPRSYGGRMSTYQEHELARKGYSEQEVKTMNDGASQITGIGIVKQCPQLEALVDLSKMLEDVSNNLSELEGRLAPFILPIGQEEGSSQTNNFAKDANPPMSDYQKQVYGLKNTIGRLNVRISNIHKSLAF